MFISQVSCWVNCLSAVPVQYTDSMWPCGSDHVVALCLCVCHQERMSQSGCRHICAGTCRHVSTPGNMPTCADMCRHMPKCDIIFGPYDANDLDLICMLTYASTCGHADMC